MKDSAKVKSIFARICNAVCLVMVAFLFITSIFTLNISSLNFAEIMKHSWLFVLFFSLVLGVIVYSVFKAINRCDDKKLKYINYVLILVLLLSQLILIVLVDIVQVTDPFLVNDQALAIAKGKEKFIDSSSDYFASFGNNYFVVVATVYFYKILMFFGISDFNNFFELLNASMIDLTILIMYKTVKLVFDERKSTEMLFLSVLNPLNYVIIFWFYTATYSMPLTVGIVYLALSIWKDDDSFRCRNYFKIAGIAILSIVGYFLRPTVLIPLIAVAVCCILSYRLNKKSIIQIVAFIAVFLITGALSYSVIHNQVYQYVEDDSDNFPVTHWVMMGLHGEGRVNLEDQDYTRSFQGKEAKKDANIREIKRTLKEMGPVGFFEHLTDKIQVTWTDGTAGYAARMQQSNSPGKLYDWIFGQHNGFLTMFCQLFRVLTLGLAGLCILSQVLDKKYDIRFLFSIILLGGIVFYLIWEAKEAYSIPFIPFLLVLSCLGMNDLCGHLENVKINTRKNAVVGIVAFMEATTLIMAMICYTDFTRETFYWRDTITYCNNNAYREYVGDGEDKKVNIRQNFYTDKEFTSIEVSCRPIDGEYSEYTMELFSDGKKLIETSVNPHMIENQKIIFYTGNQIPVGEQKYTLYIKSEARNPSIEWGINEYKATGLYKGAFYLDGEKQNMDLYMNVLNWYQAPYIGKIAYWIIVVLTMLLEAGAGFVILKRKRA